MESKWQVAMANGKINRCRQTNETDVWETQMRMLETLRRRVRAGAGHIDMRFNWTTCVWTVSSAADIHSRCENSRMECKHLIGRDRRRLVKTPTARWERSLFQTETDLVSILIQFRFGFDSVSIQFGPVIKPIKGTMEWTHPKFKSLKTNFWR